MCESGYGHNTHQREMANNPMMPAKKHPDGTAIAIWMVLLMGTWIGFTFLLTQNLATTEITYQCNNATIISSECGPSGCSTAFTLQCIGPHGIILDSGGIYAGSSTDTRIYINKSVLDTPQSGYLYKYALSDPPNQGHWVLFGAVMFLTCITAVTITKMKFNRISMTLEMKRRHRELREGALVAEGTGCRPGDAEFGTTPAASAPQLELPVDTDGQ